MCINCKTYMNIRCIDIITVFSSFFHSEYKSICIIWKTTLWTRTLNDIHVHRWKNAFYFCCIIVLPFNISPENKQCGFILCFDTQTINPKSIYFYTVSQTLSASFIFNPVFLIWNNSFKTQARWFKQNRMDSCGII